MVENRIRMTESGFCMWPGVDNNAHVYCKLGSCTCECHKEEE